MKDALSIVKEMKNQPQYKYSVLIQRHLSHYNGYNQYKWNYPKIRSMQKHLRYNDKSWAGIVAGDPNIPMKEYRKTLEYLKARRFMDDHIIVTHIK